MPTVAWSGCAKECPPASAAPRKGNGYQRPSVEHDRFLLLAAALDNSGNAKENPARSRCCYYGTSRPRRGVGLLTGFGVVTIAANGCTQLREYLTKGIDQCRLRASQVI